MRQTDGQPIFRQNLINFAGTAIVGLIGYLYLLSSGRLLGPSHYAVVAAMFSVYYLLTVPSLSLITVAARYTAALESRQELAQLHDVLGQLNVAVLFVSGIGTALYVGASVPLGAFLQVPRAAVLALSPAVFLLLFVSLNRGILQGQQRFVWLSSLQVLEVAVRLTAAVVLILAGFEAAGALSALGIALAVSFLVSLLPLRSIARVPKRLHVDIAALATLTLPTVGAIACVTLLYNVDILLVNHLFDSHTAGIYSSVATMSRVVFLLTASITAVMVPRIAVLESSGQSSIRVVGASVLGVMVVALGFVVAFLVFPTTLIFALGPRFSDGVQYLPVFALSMGCLSVANLLVNYFLVLRDYRFLPLLVAAAVAECLLIWTYHGDLWSVVIVVLAVIAVATGGLSLLLWARAVKEANQKRLDSLSELLR